MRRDLPFVDKKLKNEGKIGYNYQRIETDMDYKILKGHYAKYI